MFDSCLLRDRVQGVERSLKSVRDRLIAQEGVEAYYERAYSKGGQYFLLVSKEDNYLIGHAVAQVVRVPQLNSLGYVEVVKYLRWLDAAEIDKVF